MGGHRLFDSTYNMMGKGLDVSSYRHSLISANVANVDTIHYKPRDLDFNATLKRAMAGPPPREVAMTHEKHLDAGPPPDPIRATVYDNADAYHLDSVDIDEEMSNLVENNMKYRTTAEMMIRKMTILRHAIAEGGS
ncbi:flagellar basal-body rod protein FlgB [Desulfobotulus alkaliphilus]|uniref:Flagellar basal body rod protein FlgB n=1 Tax=Desulfobotulus alkaliphilus TaxID=622671 RepID=A0A562RTI0_9BACT|nr:flagellar basal body rod protein FlgB [Desulfobotulus alkaliphilus]TWI72427.1 flagellar basal-body rod protein FlgB [Desulfobotulus alkaliphilus]